MEMNKRELAKLYREMTLEEFSIDKAIKEIEEFLETLKEAVIIEGEVKFPKRGIFEILERKPRIISNPVTRELMKIHPKKIVRFRMSKKMK